MPHMRTCTDLQIQYLVHLLVPLPEQVLAFLLFNFIIESLLLLHHLQQLCLGLSLQLGCIVLHLFGTTHR